MKIIDKNGTEIVDLPLIKEDIDFTYERHEIPEELIKECEDLNLTTGEIYFIFDSNISNSLELISQNSMTTTNVRRDIKLDILMGDTIYHIGNEIHFKELPSRFSYYDTETKLLGRYERYNYFVDFFKKISFIASENNLGPEFEQSFILEGSNDKSLFKFVARIKPNLFINIQYTHQDGLNLGYRSNIFDGFFNKKLILDAISNRNLISITAIIRDFKLDYFID